MIFTSPLLSAKINIRIVGYFILAMRTNLKQHNWLCTSVLKTMSVCNTSLETSAVTGAQDCFCILLDQHHLAGNDNHKFILNLMPMAQRGMRIRRKHHPVHAELRQPRRVTNTPLLLAPGHRTVWFEIDQPVTYRRSVNVNLWHSLPFCYEPCPIRQGSPGQVRPENLPHCARNHAACRGRIIRYERF